MDFTGPDMSFPQSNLIDILNNVQHGFILCGTQSTKNTPTWYKTHAIVGVVSILTYKKCYAGAIFEYPENSGTSAKKVLCHV